MSEALEILKSELTNREKQFEYLKKDIQKNIHAKHLVENQIASIKESIQKLREV